MSWLAQAPANIALIKYMGKQDEQSNIPGNASLSYTLSNLITKVQMNTIADTEDKWQPLNDFGASTFTLSESAQKRFLNHLSRIKNHFSYSGSFLVQSNNNFPHASGLASSASSFAALTKCAVSALSDLTQKPVLSLAEQAQLSRQGSGSSCRSFFSPWAIWQETEVGPIELPYQNLLHKVIVVNNQEKEVSSSEAHKRVKTSPFYPERSIKAEQHLVRLMQALQIEDWNSAYQICWQEFQDMHQLFSTSSQPFSYITHESVQVLERLQNFWQQHKNGPIVTMDAGPNIHLLFRPDQAALAQLVIQEVGHYEVL
ncbi:MAG: diphosphomevalonate decarboxylase [Legionella sp.]|jgi:diphosphomevalonate decarboxylase